MKRLKTVLVSSVVLYSVAVTVPAFAQETAPAQSSSGTPPDTSDGRTAATTTPGGSEVGLEDIVVTAQRRSERLQDVPIAITATSAAKLASVGIRNAQELSVVTPALTSSNAFGYFQPRLRGIGTTANGPGIENSVAVYVDDVYIGSAAGSIFSFNNLSRIEVLKGPQGTLFGRNATGGLLNIITKDPSRTYGGSAGVSYGNYNTFSYDSYLTGPIGSNASIDLAVAGRLQGDGYGRNFATGGETNKTDHDIGFRSKLLWEPAQGTEIRIIGDYSGTRGSYAALRAFNDTRPAFGGAPPGNEWDTNSDAEQRNSFRGGGGSIRLDQDVGSLRLVSISAYRESRNTSFFDFDLTPTPALTVSFVQTDRQFSQELQLQSGSASRISWVIGGYYFDATASYDPSDFSVGAALQRPGNGFFPRRRIRTTGDQTTRSIAAFGQATVPLGNATRLTGGLRYTHERRGIEAQQTLTLVTTPNPVNLTPGGVDADKSFDKLTWRVSLDHRFAPDVLVYASFNRGYKAGGYNLGTPADRPYEPEVLDAYEVGAKMELFGKRFRLNPSFFYYDYSNIQVPYVLPTGTLGIINGPSAKIYGADVDAEWAVTDSFTLSGGITALHDRFGTFDTAVINRPNGVGNTTTIGSATGNRLPYTADFITTLGANYRIDLANGARVELNGNWNHNDGFFTAVDNIRRQGSFDLFNASIGWTSPSGTFSFKAWGKNLSNAPVILFNNAAAQVTAVTYQPPRTYGGTLGVKF